MAITDALQTVFDPDRVAGAYGERGRLLEDLSREIAATRDRAIAGSVHRDRGAPREVPEEVSEFCGWASKVKEGLDGLARNKSGKVELLNATEVAGDHLPTYPHTNTNSLARLFAYRNFQPREVLSLTMEVFRLIASTSMTEGDIWPRRTNLSKVPIDLTRPTKIPGVQIVWRTYPGNNYPSYVSLEMAKLTASQIRDLSGLRK